MPISERHVSFSICTAYESTLVGRCAEFGWHPCCACVTSQERIRSSVWLNQKNDGALQRSHRKFQMRVARNRNSTTRYRRVMRDTTGLGASARSRLHACPESRRVPGRTWDAGQGWRRKPFQRSTRSRPRAWNAERLRLACPSVPLPRRSETAGHFPKAPPSEKAAGPISCDGADQPFACCYSIGR
jgi:hypothetical protein